MQDLEGKMNDMDRELIMEKMRHKENHQLVRVEQI